MSDRTEALKEAAAIAHRYCWMPAVGDRMDNDAARIEDEILALAEKEAMSREDNFSNTPDEMWLSAAIADFAKTVRDQCRAEREAAFAHVAASRDKQTVAAWRSIERDIEAELARRRRAATLT